MNTTKPGNVDTASFEVVTSALPEAYLLVSAAGTIIAQNSKAKRLLETNVGSRLSDVSASPPEMLSSYLRKCLGSGALLPGRLSFPNSDGAPVEYRCEGAAILPSKQGDPRRIVLRLRNHQAASRRFLILNEKITDLTREVHHRMAVEEELREQTGQLKNQADELERTLWELAEQKRIADDASQKKSAFLATMSHELRTPLNAIVGYTTLLEQGLEPEGTERIRRATDHLRSIIDTILTFSSLEAGKEEAVWEDVDAVRVALDAMELIGPSAEEKKLHASVDVPDDPIPLRTDPSKARQILLNLLSNAIKFTEQGSLKVTVSRSGETVRFDVRDTGSGIEPADLERIFEPFWQADSGFARQVSGTGLGLTVTRNLARLLGGDVHARSEIGSGSTFSLVLPLQPPE